MKRGIILKKVSKRLLSVLMAVIMVLSIVPMAGVNSFAEAYAEPHGWRSGDYAFRFLADTTISIYDYFGTDKSVVIPSEINGYKVTDIYDTFYNYSFIENISIPDSVTSISCYSFKNTAYYNDERNWENDVLYIGDCLIEARDTLSGDYKIKDGTRVIAESAFEDCSSLTSVIIPDSVKHIDNYAFRGCSSLTSVTIPNNVMKICTCAFKDCTSLAEITIPNSVNEIESYAFYNTAYYNKESNWKDDKLYIGKHLIDDKNASYENEIFHYYTYPDGTAEITGYTGNDKKLVIPSEINGIKITEICSYAFRDCTSLTNVTIPNSVTYIGEGAFYECTSLESITIPDSVTSIGMVAFYNTAYYNKESNWENGVLYIDNHLIEAKNNMISRTYTVKKGTKSIAGSAFSGSDSLTSVIMPEGVKGIGLGAFQDCEALTSITIPKSVAELNYCAFEGCTSLIDVTILADDIEMYDCGLGYDYFGHFVYEKFGDIKIHGYKGYDAEKYAKNNGFTFIPLDADVSMFRLYNPNSGEHFYTADANEKNNLVSVGWKYEGIGWTAPKTSDKPVYRLYNQNGGEHHYTLDVSERDFLVSVGWTYEGIGWYSADTNGVPVYRQYNPNAFANNHNYTTDKAENDWLVSMGWKAEDIGWYGVA